ncbi:MAG: hypothetical protein ABL309_05400 [Phycisphaerales bacterium]
MPAINPVIFIIFGVIVGGILALSFIMNAAGAVFGPWSKLAQQWPATEVPTDRKPQTATFAVTSEPFTIASEARRGRFGCVFAIAGVLAIGVIVVLVGMLAGWIQSPTYLRWIATAVFGLFFFGICYWGLRFLKTKAFPQIVQFHADADHLHFRKDSDVLAKYPWISIPWVGIEDISPDPADPGRVRFHMGPYWAYADRVMVEQEMSLRTELGGEDLPPSDGEPRDPLLPRPTDIF